jgi:hypothetical protein
MARACQHSAAEGLRTSSLATPLHRLVRRAVEGPGESLPENARRQMEPRFGHRFDQIRIHADPLAAASARALRASAYTVGRDIVVDSSRFNSGTSEGQRLLAHEAAHTIQQGKESSGPLGMSDAASPQEAEADRAAQAVASGGSAQVAAAVQPGTIQREPRRRGGTQEGHRTIEPPPPATVPVTPPANTPAPPTSTPSTTPSSTPPTPTPPTPASPVPQPVDQSTDASAPAPQAPASRPHAALDASLVRTTDFHTAPPYAQTQDFQVALTYRDYHIRSPLLFGRHLDILHEPNIFAQFSFDPPAGMDPTIFGPLRNSLFGASVSLLNYHLFSLHGQDLLEVSLDAAGGAQFGDQGNSLQGQLGPTAQLHLPNLLPQLFGPGAETLLTLGVSGAAVVPLGPPPGGGPTPNPSFQFGQVSLGVKVQY